MGFIVRDSARRKERMTGTRLFVGNLPFVATEHEVRDVFSKFGTVKDCHIVTDWDTNRSKGFGFVEMSSGSEAENAIQNANGTDFGGRQLNVREARPRQEFEGGRTGDRTSDRTSDRTGGRSSGRSYGRSGDRDGDRDDDKDGGRSYGRSGGRSYGRSDGNGGGRNRHW